MPQAKKPTASTVSRTLSAAGLSKSEKYKVRIGYHATHGFKVEKETALDHATYRRVPTGRVFVSWVSGNFVRLPGDAEKESAGLTRATEILTQAGFAVHADTSPGGYMSLTVTQLTDVPQEG